VVEEIVQNAGTPYFCFKDIDENKPAGSIKIRIETITYFLKRYREDVIMKKQKKELLKTRLKEYEEKIRKELGFSFSFSDRWEEPEVPAGLPVLNNPTTEVSTPSSFHV
jgi:hypothetical protein